MSAKSMLVLVCLFSLVSVVSATSWAQTPYVVRKGDTLLNIADQFVESTSKKDPKRYEFARKIQALNPQIKNPNALEPGQTLNLPIAPKPAISEKVAEPIPSPEKTPTPKLHKDESVKAEVINAPKTPEPPPVYQSPSTATAPESHAAPTEAAKPAAPHSETPHESEHPDFIFVQPRFQNVKIKTTELVTHKKATMKSQSSYGLDLQYGKILNHHFHLLFQAGITQTKFKDINYGTVNHTTETLKSFAVGVAYEATSTLHLDLLAMSADRTFLLPVTPTEYELHAVTIPGAELNISWDFYSGNSSIFGISAIGEYIGEAKKHGVKYKSAVEPLGALYWKSNYGHDDVNCKVTLTFKHGHQETSISEQSEDLGILGVGLYF